MANKNPRGREFEIAKAAIRSRNFMRGFSERFSIFTLDTKRRSSVGKTDMIAIWHQQNCEQIIKEKQIVKFYILLWTHVRDRILLLRLQRLATGLWWKSFPFANFMLLSTMLPIMNVLICQKKNFNLNCLICLSVIKTQMRIKDFNIFLSTVCRRKVQRLQILYTTTSDTTKLRNIDIMSEISNSRVLLPSSVKPVHYSLDITPDLEKLEFAGTETVDVLVLEKTKIVQVHGKQIQILSARFVSSSVSVPQEAVEISYHSVDTTITFTFSEELGLGEGRLILAFAGILNGDMAGFYKSSYVNADGKRSIMASTQFEALDARRAFP